MSCCICSQIEGERSNDLFAQEVGAPDYIRRVPVETPNFAVIPSLGPLVQGHVILCPKMHYRSFASLPPRYDVEVQGLIEGVKAVLLRLYSVPIHLFEHGMSRDGSRVLCSVDHAHLHLVPAPVSIAAALLPYPVMQVPCGLAGLRGVVGTEEYVFYESPEGSRCAIRAQDHEFSSQFLRRVFADALGHASEWNWREHMKAEEAHHTFERLKDAMAGSDFSARI